MDILTGNIRFYNVCRERPESMTRGSIEIVVCLFRQRCGGRWVDGSSTVDVIGQCLRKRVRKTQVAILL
eukprot:6993175-Prorocentrum_lima.AAC.1